MGTYCRNVSDCFNKSDFHCSFFPAANDDFVEETCDSDSYLNPEKNSCSHSGKVNKKLGQCQLFIADDAQSTTSNSSCVEDWNQECEEGNHAESIGLTSYINYLQNASDDDLGLPPNPKDDDDKMQVGFSGDGDLVQTMDLDLEFDVDFNEGKAESDHEDDTLFWLSFLRG